MKDSFNDKVKDAFDLIEDDFNPELIWEGINSKTKTAKKKRRRFFFWWMSSASIVIVVFSILLYQVRFGNQKDTNLKALIDVEQTISRLDDNGELSDFTNIDPNITQSNEIITNDLKVNRTIANITSSNYEEVGTNNIIQLNAELASTDKPVIIKNVNESQNSGVDQNATGHEENESTSSSIDLSDREYQFPFISKTMINERSNTIQFNILGLEISKPKPLTANINIDQPNIQIISTKNNNFRSRNKQVFSNVEIYGGISIGSKTSQSSVANYALIRNESEKLLEQLNLGARVELFKLYNYSFWTGIKYTVINEKWSNNLEYYENWPITYVDYVIENANGDLEEHRITENLDHEVKWYLERYNSEQIISVPFEIRYGKQFNNWMFSLGVGVDLNYLFATEHSVIGLNGLPTDDIKSNQWLDPTLSMGLYTSYAFHPKWNITAGLNYSKLSINNSLLVPDLNSNYNLVGLQLGLSRKLK